jgi:hypothetical protein
MSNNALIKRLEALERAIVTHPHELIFVWTRSLAERIEPLLPKDRNYRVVCYPMPDEDGSFEAELREQNPEEAARLDALLRGEIPSEHYPAVTPNGVSLP